MRTLATQRPLWRAGIVVTLLSALSAVAAAVTCTVPGSHTTIGAAAADPTCSEVALAAGTYPESLVLSRALSISGSTTGTTRVEGLMEAKGPGTEVHLRNLRVENGCASSALSAKAGARITTEKVEVLRSPTLPCPLVDLFADGFESGDTSAWSAQFPGVGLVE